MGFSKEAFTSQLNCLILRYNKNIYSNNENDLPMNSYLIEKYNYFILFVYFVIILISSIFYTFFNKVKQNYVLEAAY